MNIRAKDACKCGKSKQIASRTCRECYAELKSPPLASRFWSKVEKTDSCWLWKGASGDNRGYGRFTTENKLDMAHRVAYELLVGPIAEGLTIDHLCKNRSCVNPAHLEPVTLGDNVRRYYSSLLTCKNGHPKTTENAGYRSSGRRTCRLCDRQNTRNSRAKRRSR